MNENYKDMTVGQIVADKFDNSKVFNDFGIGIVRGAMESNSYPNT